LLQQQSGQNTSSAEDFGGKHKALEEFLRQRCLKYVIFNVGAKGVIEV